VEETLEEEKETDEKLIELAKEILSHGTYDSEAIAILSNVEIGYQHVELATSHFGKCFGYASRNSYFKTAGGGSPRHRWARLPIASAIASPWFTGFGCMVESLGRDLNRGTVIKT
jgi:hypothetical protein